MSGMVFIVGDSLEPGHPGLEAQADEPTEEQVDAAVEELAAEARAQEAKLEEHADDGAPVAFEDEDIEPAIRVESDENTVIPEGEQLDAWVAAEEGRDENSDEDPDGDGPKLTAADTIDQIEAAKTAEEVDSLSEGDDRVTVQRAAEKRKEELSDDES